MNTPLKTAVARAHAVFFDLFHTLTSVDETSPGSPHTADLLGVGRDAWIEQVLENSPWRQTGEIRDPVEIIGRMARAIDPSLPDELILRVAENRIRRFAQSLLEPPARSLDALRGLRLMGKKIALVSNADAGEMRAWNDSPLAPFFDCAVFSCDIGVMKPDRRIFIEALKRLGEEPGGCLYVGDGGAEELRAARELGFTTVMVTGYVKIPPEQAAARRVFADYIVEFVNELLPSV